MTLGEFRKLTEDVSDETPIIIRNYFIEFSLEEIDISYSILKDVLVINI